MESLFKSISLFLIEDSLSLSSSSGIIKEFKISTL